MGCRVRRGEVLNFRERNDAELAKVSDEELVRYIVEARGAGRIEAATIAAQVLALRYEPRIKAYVATRLQSKGPLVIEDVAERTLSDAIASVGRFQGATIPEFGGFIFRIAKLRIVDYHRKGRADETPLDVMTPDGEWQHPEIKTGDPTELVDRGDVINQALGELNERHREVVILVRFRRYSHREAAQEINRQFTDAKDDPMSEQNVSQINSRFGRRLDELLEQADDPPPLDDDG